MNRKQTGVALGTAVAIATGGLAVGSQLDGGTADAAKSRKGITTEQNGDTGTRDFVRGHPGPPILVEKAKALGVSEDALRKALEAARPEPHAQGGDPRERHARELAEALGVEQSKVEAALRKLRPEHPRRGEGPFADLAKELGVERSKLRTALREMFESSDRPRPGSDEFVKALASKLGVDEAKVKAALPGAKPRMKMMGPRAAALAKELGLDESKVATALEKLRASHEAEHQARRDAFVKKLASELNVSEEKVKEVFGEGPGFGGPGRHGPGGPGPGGPGPGGHGPGGRGGHGPGGPGGPGFGGPPPGP